MMPAICHVLNFIRGCALLPDLVVAVLAAKERQAALLVLDSPEQMRIAKEWTACQVRGAV